MEKSFKTGTFVKSYSGDLYLVPVGKESQIDAYMEACKAVEMFPDTEPGMYRYDDAVWIMTKLEEGYTGWKPVIWKPTH